MKQISFLLPSALAVALGVTVAACSESEPLVVDKSDSNAIRFAASTEFSRAGDITTNNLTSFNVYAYTGGTDPQLFMNNVKVTKTGTNLWTYSPVQYWPADKTVDFYAFAPETWVNTGGPLKPSSYESYPGTEDLIYAVSTGLKGNTGTPNAQVIFNFRHALSKVTVKMSSSNAALTVKVSNVVMANIMSKGNFTFPAASTTGAPTEESVGKWDDQNTPMVYLYHMSQSPSDLITLTTTPTAMDSTGLGFGGAKFMIPQVLTYRSGGNGHDTYLAVMCSVYDTKSGAKLWPNANTPEQNLVENSKFGDGLLKFPLSTSSFSEWHPGVHYIYNLVINSNEEMGAIDFGTPTVDTFVQVTSNYE